MPAPSLLEMFAAHGAAFTPANISGIVEYWDFADTSKITSSSGLVTQVTGQLGVYNLTASGAGRPTTGTRTINSLNTLDFDGSANTMTATITSVAQALTFLLVYQNDTTANDQRVIDSTSRPLYDAALLSSGGKRAIYAGSSVVAGGAATTNAEQVVAVIDNVSSQVWVNGVSDITGNPGAASTGTTLYIGADTAGNSPFDGRIGFIGLISGTISSGDRALWNTYDSRWGL